ncbi:MAG: LysR family transcriptional regulator [Lachnospira pectinoschiza]
MLEVKELQYFVVCADLSSFSRAAEVLYTTQPNVSKVVRSLEEKLGFEVFERDNRGIKLTRRGRQAYEYAGKILEQNASLRRFIRLMTGKIQHIKQSQFVGGTVLYRLLHQIF